MDPAQEHGIFSHPEPRPVPPTAEDRWHSAISVQFAALTQEFVLFRRQVDDRHNGIENLLRSIHQKLETRMSQLDDAVAALDAKVTAETAVIDGAIVYIKTVPQLIADAVAAAIAQGATPAQLQAITDLGAKLDAKGADLAAALAANTPTPPPSAAQFAAKKAAPKK